MSSSAVGAIIVILADSLTFCKGAVMFSARVLRSVLTDKDVYFEIIGLSQSECLDLCLREPDDR